MLKPFSIVESNEREIDIISSIFSPFFEVFFLSLWQVTNWQVSSHSPQSPNQVSSHLCEFQVKSQVIKVHQSLLFVWFVGHLGGSTYYLLFISIRCGLSQPRGLALCTFRTITLLSSHKLACQVNSQVVSLNSKSSRK